MNQQNEIYNSFDKMNRIWFFFCKKRSYDWHDLLNNSSTICDCSLYNFMILFKVFHIWKRRNSSKFFILYDFVRRTFAIIASFSFHEFIFNDIRNSFFQSFEHMIYDFLKQLMKNIKHDDAMNIQIMMFLYEVLNIMQIVRINKLDVVFSLFFKLLSCWFMRTYFIKFLQIFSLLWKYCTDWAMLIAFNISHHHLLFIIFHEICNNWKTLTLSFVRARDRKF